MEKLEKVREHIRIPAKNKMQFIDVVGIIAAIGEDILKDTFIPFSFINEQGLMVGSESIFPAESYVHNEGTLFRAFTKKGRWRMSAIRDIDTGFVTLIELVAPIDTAEKITEVADFLIKRLKAERAVV